MPVTNQHITDRDVVMAIFYFYDLRLLDVDGIGFHLSERHRRLVRIEWIDSPLTNPGPGALQILMRL